MGYWIKTLLGWGIFLGAVVLFNVKLSALLDTGTCASGNTPYVIARECPEGTGTDMLLLTGSIFLGLAGLTLVALRGKRPGADPMRVSRGPEWGLWAWSIYFVGSGAWSLYYSLTADVPPDAELGGAIVGGTFLFLGLPPFIFAGAHAWGQFKQRRERGDIGIGSPAEIESDRPPAPAPAHRPATPAASAPTATGPWISSLSPAPADTPPTDPGDDPLARLERLQKLREAGALTDEEFNEQKRRLLSQ